MGEKPRLAGIDFDGPCRYIPTGPCGRHYGPPTNGSDGRGLRAGTVLPAAWPEAADAVLDVSGGDVNHQLLMVRDTVSQVIGTPARSNGEPRRTPTPSARS